MPFEMHWLIDIALAVFILAVLCYASFGPSGWRRR